MKEAPIPENEAARLFATQSLGILDTPYEERFDVITRAAAVQPHAPICTISIIDKDREWFKSCVGTPAREGERAVSFCGHTITQGSMFIIEDTLKNPDFADNPQVVNPPHVRFYAGITLHDNKTHLPIGAFCIKDTEPRSLSMTELNDLMSFAKQAETELNKKSA